MSDTPVTEEVVVEAPLPEGWKEATTEVAPTAKYIDEFGTYHDADRKTVAFTQPDGTVIVPPSE